MAEFINAPKDVASRARRVQRLIKMGVYVIFPQVLHFKDVNYNSITALKVII